MTLPPQRLARFETLDQMLTGLVDLADDPDLGLIDHSRGAGFMSYNHTILVERPELSIGLRDIGFTQRRWNSFRYAYLDASSLDRFFALAARLETGQQVVYQTPQTNRHKHGNCILALTARRMPHPELAVTSRAMLLHPTGILDSWLAKLVSERLAALWGLETVPVRFEIRQLQFSVIMGMGFLVWSGLVDLEGEYPVDSYRERVQRRFHQITARPIKFARAQRSLNFVLQTLEWKAAGHTFPWGLGDEDISLPTKE